MKISKISKICALTSLTALTPVIFLSNCAKITETKLHDVTLENDMSTVYDQSKPISYTFKFTDSIKIEDNFVSLPAITFEDIYVIDDGKVTKYNFEDIFTFSLVTYEDNTVTYELKLTEPAINTKTYAGTTVFLTNKVMWLEGSKDNIKEIYSKNINSLIYMFKHVDDSIEARTAKGQQGCVMYKKIELLDRVDDDCFIEMSPDRNPLETHPLTISSFKLSEDRKSINLYVYDVTAQRSEYTQSTAWCDFAIVCKRKLTETTVETVWKTQFRNVHFDFKKPEITVAHTPTQFTAGSTDYSVDLDLTGTLITAAGDVKAEIAYYKPGELIGNSFDTSKFNLTETFTATGATKFTLTFGFTKETVATPYIPPQIGVKLSYADSDGNETYCIHQVDVKLS